MNNCRKQAVAIQSLDFAAKIEELKQLEDIFPQNQLNKFINSKLKEIVEIQSSIKLHNLNYSTSGKNYNFTKYLLPVLLSKNLYDGSLTLQDTDWVESKVYLRAN